MKTYEQLEAAPASQMTVREKIAAMALQGFLAGRNANMSYDTHRDAAAKSCVAYAEALIRALVA